MFNAPEKTIKEAEAVEQLNKIKPLKSFLQFSRELDKRQTEFRKKGYSAQREEILNWFSANYTDPVNCCPYESAEGGYLYIWGGPYDAREEIEQKFGGIARQGLIDKIVAELEVDSDVWSGYPSQD